jgi:hypothetical protein
MTKINITLLAVTAVIAMASLENAALCQQVTRARTEDGKEVLLYPDGTWKSVEGKAPVSVPPPPLIKPPSAKMEYKIRDGRFSLWVDPTRWKCSPVPAEPPMELRLNHQSGDGYLMVVAERLSIPITSLKEIVVEHARQVAEGVHVILEEKRTVNGHEVLCLQMEGTIKEIPFTYYGYYYSGESGTIQVITYTGRNLFKEFLADFTAALNGLEIH